MTAEKLPTILPYTLQHEGGWSHHPNDPGGATMRGVIQRVYDGYRDRKGLGRRSVRLIEEAELVEIYRGQYWAPIRGDDLPAGIDLCVFDAAVNSGPVQAAKWLQRALGVTADGHIGEGTLTALLQHGDHAALINSMCDQRLAFMKGLRNRKTGKPLWPDFGKGWSRRVADIRAAAIEMADAALGPAAVADDAALEPEPEYAFYDAYQGGKALPPVIEPTRPARSRTLWSVAIDIATKLGIGVSVVFGFLRDHPEIVLALIVAGIAISLFIGRERLRKLWDEHVAA